MSLSVLYRKSRDPENIGLALLLGLCAGGQPLLPIGPTNVPYEKLVKLHCRRCEEIYSPKSSCMARSTAHTYARPSSTHVPAYSQTSAKLELRAVGIFTANGHRHTAAATVPWAFAKTHFWYGNGMVADR